jgi:hypothetical protein
MDPANIVVGRANVATVRPSMTNCLGAWSSCTPGPTLTAIVAGGR